MNARAKRRSSSDLLKYLLRHVAFQLTALAAFFFFLLWYRCSFDALLSLVAVVSCASLGILVRLTLSCRSGLAQSPTELAGLETANIFSLSSHLRNVHESLARGLRHVAQREDRLFRLIALRRLNSLVQDVQTMADGRIVYFDIEAWQTAYERILRSPGLTRYWSVAWLRNEDYWRDAPGEHSMQLNYDLIQLGVRIERILILNDFFWPPAAVLPAKSICKWIDQQFRRGIVVWLIRESQVDATPELLCDFGIYGNRAGGLLELDEQCRTIRFTLDFSPEGLGTLEDRWDRLMLFAVSYRKLLDRLATLQ